MAIIKLSTSLKCIGCVAAIKADLNTIVGKDQWRVDLTALEKTLELRDYGGDLNMVIKVLQGKGYHAKLMPT